MTADVLFLDDMQWRHREFRRLVERRGDDVRVWHVHTANEAIELLGRVSFAQVFLDHDLSEEDVMVQVDAESIVPTGMVVVDHIVDMDKPPPDVIVHSLNGPAREEMVRRLQSCPGVERVRGVPFTDLVVRLQ